MVFYGQNDSNEWPAIMSNAEVYQRYPIAPPGEYEKIISLGVSFNSITKTGSVYSDLANYRTFIENWCHISDYDVTYWRRA
jgi:hypothetical protein